MGIVATRARYENAIKKLFPQGEYWDKQFADPQSDVSFFVKSKASELVKFRERMNTLSEESKPESTTELIADWERVYLNGEFPNISINQRRLLFKSRNDLSLNRAELQKTAEMFGLNIQDVTIPYRPRFFGFAKFAQERLGSFLTFSVLRIEATEAGLEAKYWQAIKAELEVCRFARMRFAFDRMAYYPINKMREIVYRKVRQGCFGYGRFAHNRITPFAVNEHAAGILRAAGFYKRFERVLLDEYLTRVKPYYEFEGAVRNKLLANQIPYFYYEGE
ncbi:MAG: hypothetical protein LBH20_01705 [Treponema sp.]|jgi:uncharacterized protein YmfQ (DUF2313 family)|nr:hypothetical protein [Treponema sp.]